MRPNFQAACKFEKSFDAGKEMGAHLPTLAESTDWLQNYLSKKHTYYPICTVLISTSRATTQCLVPSKVTCSLVTNNTLDNLSAPCNY